MGHSHPAPPSFEGRVKVASWRLKKNNICILPGCHPGLSWLDCSPACKLSNSDCAVLSARTVGKGVRVKVKTKAKKMMEEGNKENDEKNIGYEVGNEQSRSRKRG